MRKPKPVEKTAEPEYPKLEATKKISEFTLFGSGGRILLSAALVATLATGCRLAGVRVPRPVAPQEEVRLAGTPAINPPKPGDQIIHFDFDKAHIRSGDVPALEQLAAQLKQNPAAKILIEGHCDEQGSIEYNFALGQRRAEVAREFLISRGVDPARIATISKGEEQPADSGHSEEAWSKNRRDEIRLVVPAREKKP